MSDKFINDLWSVLKFLDEISHLSYYSSHIVRESGLALIIFKCMSDIFTQEQLELALVAKEQEENRQQYFERNVWYIPKGARWDEMLSNDTTQRLGENISQAFRLLEEQNNDINGMLIYNFEENVFDKRALLGLYSKLSYVVDFNEQNDYRDGYIYLFEFILSKSYLKKGVHLYSETTKKLLEYLISKLKFRSIERYSTNEQL